MSTLATPENLTKASEIIGKVYRELSANVVAAAALLVTAQFVAIVRHRFPVQWQPAVLAIAVFATTYFVALLWQSTRVERMTRYHLKGLGEDEKAVLKPFLLQDRRTFHLNLLRSPVGSLVTKGILTPAISLIPIFNAPLVLQPAAAEYLQHHPELIGMRKDQIGTEEYDDEDCPFLQG